MALLPNGTHAVKTLETSLESESGSWIAARRRIAVAVPPTVVFVVVVAAWQLASSTGLLNKFIAPSPLVIASDLIALMGKSFFWTSAEATFVETVVGFALGVSAGLLVGMLTALFPMFRRSIYPHALAFQIIPRTALAPLFLIWFGFGISSKVAMAASLSFFPLVVSAVAGVQSVDRDAHLLMRSLGVSPWKMFRYLILPSAAPVIAAGVKLALTLALIGSVVGEFVGGSVGLGVMLTEFEANLDVPRVYAIIVFLALMGLALYGLIAWAEHKFIFWTNKSAV